jgi:hypothetical protein
MKLPSSFLMDAVCLRIQWGESSGTLFGLIPAFGEHCLLPRGNTAIAHDTSSTRTGAPPPVMFLLRHLLTCAFQITMIR